MNQLNQQPVFSAAYGSAGYKWPTRLFLVFLLGVFVFFPFFEKSPSHQNFLILVLMAAQLGVAWNIIGGYAGQVSLGQVAFYGLGAYTSTLLFTKFGINPWFAIPAGGLLAACISLAVGWSCFRLKGHYFAMATIAVAEIIQIVFTNWDFAGAAVGLNLPMEGAGSILFLQIKSHITISLLACY